MLKKLRVSGSTLFALSLLLFSAICFAQTTTSTTAPTSSELITQAVATINNWRNLGLLAGLVGSVNLLVNLTKLPGIKAWIDREDAYSRTKKWIRPILAVLSASLAAVLVSVNAGANLWLAMGHGALAGMAASGFHEIKEAILAMIQSLKKAPA